MNHLLWVTLQDHTAKHTMTDQCCNQNNVIFRLFPMFSKMHASFLENIEKPGKDVDRIRK